MRTEHMQVSFSLVTMRDVYCIDNKLRAWQQETPRLAFCFMRSIDVQQLIWDTQ